MHLTASELARIEAMLESGQVFSEPVSLSCTDRMLDTLLARAGGAKAARARPPRVYRKSAAGESPRRYSDWLNLPSLDELMDARRSLLRRTS